MGTVRIWLVAAMAGVVLAGCSAGGALMGSAFGPATSTRVAEVEGIGNYGADEALRQARAHFKASDFGYSAAFYKRVVELSPKNAEGYVGLSASYDRLGRFDLSDRVYASLYELSGGTAQYYNNVGYSYLLRGNVAAAFGNFRKAQKLDPDNVVIANNLMLLANAARA